MASTLDIIMRALIVEDDLVSRKFLEAVIKEFGECEFAVNGKDAISAFERAHAGGAPYDLICLDIMMPEIDGQQVLRSIRSVEDRLSIPAQHSVKVIMTTALEDAKNVLAAFRSGCEAYLTKPLDKGELLQKIRELGFEPRSGEQSRLLN